MRVRVWTSLSDLVAGKSPRDPWEWTDEPETLTAQAIRASEVTHQHPEGIVGGDVDTTAAIVGGIVAKPPQQWVAEREDLPDRVRR
ncbi:ADP-ribosylglycohydrolase family protein [Lentzea flava]|uniref:ADP-ribosylglycohydrolase n=1 Tax=Lentzea flava TaxID=103732 RepID=A0ABQ2UUA9_9PSEU|nr:ADP-ribosylglycohydrolase family protein [Lentzea flava]MCP2201550.1 hypothetical protein [Lentzea flava]GGU52035.1 hypothetical protein GCM10010178_50980 [Lentzea flava]